MTFTSFDAVFFTVAFLVPGFIWESVLHLTGLLSQRAVVRRLLARYGVYTVHPVPTAWDYVFSHSTGSWVLVTLTDGSTVAGVFSARSFASSDAAERDLFLERLCKVEDDGHWQPVPMNRGVWIQGEDIRAIEFLEFQE